VGCNNGEFLFEAASRAHGISSVRFWEGNAVRKRKRSKRERRQERKSAEPFSEGSGGLHGSFLAPGSPPPGMDEELTAAFQRNIRNSPIWNLMVQEFGEEKAEELLKEFKAEIR
jgi:hypothetical protein